MHASTKVNVCICKMGNEARVDGWMDGWMDGCGVYVCMCVRWVMLCMHLMRGVGLRGGCGEVSIYHSNNVQVVDSVVRTPCEKFRFLGEYQHQVTLYLHDTFQCSSLHIYI
jgi:hypothetical protein